jgi:hypothetical protein
MEFRLVDIRENKEKSLKGLVPKEMVITGNYSKSTINVHFGVNYEPIETYREGN